jgi:hypothetical protein
MAARNADDSNLDIATTSIDRYWGIIWMYYFVVLVGWALPTDQI